MLRSYSSGSWVYGLWNNKLIFQTAKPAENLPYMEKLDRYIEENNVTVNAALMMLTAEFQDDFIYEYFRLDIDSSEISPCRYPEPQAISPRCYYYLDGDKLMYLDTEGEEH